MTVYFILKQTGNSRAETCKCVGKPCKQADRAVYSHTNKRHQSDLQYKYNGSGCVSLCVQANKAGCSRKHKRQQALFPQTVQTADPL